MLELPLVVVNVQRGGPSTGLPTKTEQADLFQALYGRNGEAPIPVLAARSPRDCFATTYEAVRIAIEHMTPVFILSDGYLANGAEPWRYPSASDLAPIHPPLLKALPEDSENFLPYKRDEKLVRQWAIPGVAGLEHRVGGLEKQHETGSVSYDPNNHEFMVRLRAEKVALIANEIPEQQIEHGPQTGDVLIVGWGSTYGAIKTAVKELESEGYAVAHTHLRYINPLPRNLENLLRNFKHVLVPEMNSGQLLRILRAEYLVNARGLNKIKGLPFTASEIKETTLNLLQS